MLFETVEKNGMGGVGLKGANLWFLQIPSQSNELLLPRVHFGYLNFAVVAAPHLGCLREEQGPDSSGTFWACC